MLHAARGWRQRQCPACKARPGERCLTTRGRPATRPHTARLHPTRGELHTPEDVWRALERAAASGALVRLSGGGGRHGTLESVTIQAGEHELARVPSASESELADALAAPAWGRYGTFRGHPPITATLAWNVADRSLTLAGRRGNERFQEILHTATRTPIPASHDASRDTSRGTRERAPKPGGNRTPAHAPMSPTPPIARAAGAASRSTQALVRRRDTAPSAAARPRPAPGYASCQDDQASRHPSAAPSATARCPPDCDPRRDTAPSAAARPPHAPGSRSHDACRPTRQPRHTASAATRELRRATRRPPLTVPARSRSTDTPLDCAPTASRPPARRRSSASRLTRSPA
jgi:hypothetical protein